MEGLNESIKSTLKDILISSEKSDPKNICLEKHGISVEESLDLKQKILSPVIEATVSGLEVDLEDIVKNAISNINGRESIVLATMYIVDEIFHFNNFMSKMKKGGL